MKILLTGPTGFIGLAFARLAAPRGHQVLGLALPSEVVPSDAPNGLLWARGTLQAPPLKAIADFAPDTCVHTAWVTAPGVYLESPDNYAFRDSSLSFVRRCVETGVGRVVALGTCIEYRITHAPLSEAATPVEPTTTYSRCKNELRLALEQESAAGGFGFCWPRVFYPYGPREHPSRLCSSIIDKLDRGETVELKTPASTKDYIFIEDLAAALLAVVESPCTGTINLGTGMGVSVREIASLLGRILGKESLVTEAAPPALDPLDYVVADASRLRSLGWRPAHDMASGLEKLVRWRAARPA